MRHDLNITAGDELHEECGVFGMYDFDHGDVASTIYYGLFALQHRGQESCGIAVSDTAGPKGKVNAYKGMGLCNEVFTPEILEGLHGNIGVGHVRYSTAGSSTRENAQPLVLNYIKGTLALAHNGNLVNAPDLRRELEYSGAIFQTTIDSEVIAYHIARERVKTSSVEEAVAGAMKKIVGAYSLVAMSPRKMIGARDPFGFKPLCIGKRDNAYILVSESCALDLGSAEAKAWIGVENPHRADVLTELRRSTVARVCTGRAGPRLRTQALLRFLADHSRSKDTVLKEVPEEWVKAQGLLEVRSEISDKNLYLTRPDMGRRLCAEAVEALKAQCVANPDVQVVISDGLSTDAITVNYEEILPPLMAGLKQAGLKVGTPFFVRYGRVKIEDQIGEILGAKVVILLVGERPGLGQSESLSCYAVYSPRMATTVEADRTCISNIHQGGTPPVEAAAVIVDLAKRMLEQKASGINMTR